MNLGLGTVQFGRRYGVMNTAGPTRPEDVAGMLDVAAENGVLWLDTAPGYGDSECLLGDLLRSDHPFRIVTKTPSSRNGPTDPASVTRTFEESLRRLRQERLYGLLVHSASDLLDAGGEGLYDALREIRRRGQVQRIGVSVYEAATLDAVLERFSVDLVQAPASVLDQRLLRSGHLSRLRDGGVEVHVRSALLQGILPADPDRIPSFLGGLVPTLRRLHDLAKARECTVLEAAIGFLTQSGAVDVLICGVETQAQLRESVEALRVAADSVWDGLEGFAVEDPDLIDPSRWPRIPAEAATGGTRCDE